MGYQTRARNFSFMGVESIRKTFEVVPPKEDFATLPDRPKGRGRSVAGTVGMGLTAFVRARKVGDAVISADGIVVL
ncbi:hypothetical protein EON82_06050 [bacterium]|nr:MAG: hypothetical protein EON82_06050 [bacterium]